MDDSDRALPARQTLLPSEAALFLELDGGTVLELAEHGELPGHNVLGSWLFIRDELRAWRLAGGVGQRSVDASG